MTNPQPKTALQILQLNNLLDLLEDANDYAHSISTDNLNVNIRSSILEARALVNTQLGRIAAVHIRNLHKAAGSPNV